MAKTKEPLPIILFETQSDWDNWLAENHNTQKGLRLHRMAVAPESRKQGVAAKLLEFAETLAKEQGLMYLKTDTFSQNEKMNRLLAKNGYRRIGTMSFRGKALPFYCYDKCL